MLCNEIFCGVSSDTIQVNNLKIDGVSAGNGSQNIAHNGAFDFDVVSFIPDTQFGALGTGSGTLAVITGTVGNDYLEGIAGADTIDGLDTLYGSDEQGTFVFDTTNATNNTDVIEYFSARQGDQLDISDLLTGFTLGVSDINNFVRLTEASGSTTIAIDGRGGASYSNIAVLNGVTGLDADLMLTNEVFIT